MAVDAHGMPIRAFITDGTTADCKQAEKLIDKISAEFLLADKAYDTNAIVEHCETQGIKPVIPPIRNRKGKRPCDLDLYKLRHLIENAFLQLKR